MKLSQYIITIQTHLVVTHAKVLKWFDSPDEMLNYCPKDGGWTVSEILEHIGLTSYYLLILIDKAADKALRNINDLSLEKQLDEFKFDLERINTIGVHKSFEWIRPEHMEPSGEKGALAVKDQLISQLYKCLTHLETLKDGQGLLYQTTMSVNQLGKINVYEYIYFLSAHAERHLQQMEENEREFSGK